MPRILLWNKNLMHAYFYLYESPHNRKMFRLLHGKRSVFGEYFF